MRVALLTPEFPPRCGGIGRFTVGLGRELARRGHDVHVFVRSRFDESSTMESLTVRRLAVSSPAPLSALEFRHRVEPILRSNRFDLVHVQSTALIRPSVDVRVVTTCHCCIATSTEPLFRPVRDLSSLYRVTTQPIYQAIERDLARHTRLTVVSESMARDFDRVYGVLPEVVGNSVDLELFQPGPEVRADQVVFAGPLTWGKGVQDLLEAIRILNRTMPRVEFLICGDGPARARLEGTARRFRLTNARFLGAVEPGELARLFGGAALSVLPSYYEGLPTVVLEALACETPMVTTRVPGCTDIVSDGVVGLLVPTHAPEHLAEAIRGLMSSEALRSAMGKRGREVVASRFTWKHVGDRVMESYGLA